jgi:hypothetical protein
MADSLKVSRSRVLASYSPDKPRRATTSRKSQQKGPSDGWLWYFDFLKVEPGGLLFLAPARGDFANSSIHHPR